LGEHFIAAGFDVDIHNDEMSGLFAAQNKHYDIVLLDIVTSNFDGFELLKALREACRCPIIVITSREDHFDIIYSLEIGADDYLVKPIHQSILIARIKASIRRSSYAEKNSDEYVLSINNLSLCQTTQKSFCNDELLNLTAIEFNLLYFLMSYVGKTISKESIAKCVLGRTISYNDHCIEMHISNIRKKITLLSSNNESSNIKTIRGSGYVFLASSSRSSESYQKKEISA